MSANIIAHTQFVRETHYFFSTGKDKVVKYWNADRFEHILTLRAHQAEVWSVVVSRNGGFVASTSRDKTLRLWRRTDEQVFVEEEREAELEEMFEAGIEKQQAAVEAEEAEADALGLEGGSAEAGTAGKKGMESIKGAERVLEALRVLAEEEQRVTEHAAAVRMYEARAAAAMAAGVTSTPKRPVLVPNMLLLGLSEGAYLLKHLGSVRPSELEQALLLLPFDASRSLLARLQPLITTSPQIELIARCVVFLLKVQHKQVVANQSMLALLHQVDEALRTRLLGEQSVLGYNLAAMRFAQQTIELESSAAFFEGAVNARALRNKATTSELRRETIASLKTNARGAGAGGKKGKLR